MPPTAFSAIAIIHHAALLPRLAILVLGVTTVALAACGGDSPTAPRRPRFPKMETVSGDLQTGEVGTTLPIPPVVRIIDSLGAPMAGHWVFFRGEGTIAQDSAVTDSIGAASALRWTLGPRAAVQRIEAHAILAGYRNGGYVAASFRATAVAGRPEMAGVVSGDSAVAIPGTELDTVAAYVSDRFGNRLADVAVRWTVTEGDGRVEPVLQGVRSVTDARGVARAVWTMGPQLGRNVLAVTGGTGSGYFIATGATPLTASRASVGSTHSCATAPSGAAFCWGLNLEGQLGTGAFDYWPGVHKRAVRVQGAKSFVSLTAGAQHTCGLTSSGAAYCWGANGSGQLGDGTSIGRAEPTPVKAGGDVFTALATGDAHTCGLTGAGRVLCWGDNTSGQLGDGTVMPHVLPQPVLGTRTFMALAVGGAFTCAISTDDKTYCWGRNGSGQLGITSADKCLVGFDDYYYYGPYEEPCSLSPLALGVDPKLVGLATGVDGACGMTPTPETYCWGSGTMSPQPVRGAPALTSVVAGAGTACGLDAGGEVYCWNYGRHDGGSLARRLTNDGLVFASLSAYASHFCGVATGVPSVIYCWGENSVGQLGDGTTRRRPAPVRVVSPVVP